MTTNSETPGLNPGSAERDALMRLFHDMRTPLNIIIGWADLMARGEVDPISPQQKECLGYILEAGHQLAKLLDSASLDVRTRADGGSKE